MGLIEKLKIAGEQATAAAHETLHESELRHELRLVYAELGRATYGLVERGALAHERLVSGAERIRTLERELVDLTPRDPDQPQASP